VNQDRVKGTIDEVVGSAKQKAGEWTGNTRLQVEGIAQQVKGKAENALGKTKDVVREVVEGAGLQVDTHVEVKLKCSTPEAERGKDA
jgi:uncharacterized protein YjbJ (UPF0337 family)